MYFGNQIIHLHHFTSQKQHFRTCSLTTVNIMMVVLNNPGKRRPWKKLKRTNSDINVMSTENAAHWDCDEKTTCYGLMVCKLYTSVFINTSNNNNVMFVNSANTQRWDKEMVTCWRALKEVIIGQRGVSLVDIRSKSSSSTM